MNRTDEARITEDEATAQAANPDEQWSSMTEETDDGENVYFTVDSRAATRPAPFVRILEMTETDRLASARAEHIAAWDPARVLAECAIKRQLIMERDEARAALSEARQLMRAWDEEGLGHVPGIGYTNWPDAWTDLRNFLRRHETDTA